MVEGAALVYSLIASFVLTSTQRNKRHNRPHSKPLVYAGWVLTGASFAASGLLGLMAVQQALA